MPPMEVMLPTRYFTEARFGKWDAVLKEHAPPADLTFTTGIWHYARGLAFAAKNRPDDALNEKKKLDTIVAATPPDRIVGFNSANRLLSMASATLAGEIESAQGKHDDAVKHLQEAVALSGRAQLRRTTGVVFPVRETLGMELLAGGKTADAEQVFRDDLKQYPENGWSLNGLAICLRARKRVGRGGGCRCSIQEGVGACRRDAAGVGGRGGDCLGTGEG